MRISEEIDVSVLKRKCGLICLASAAIFAASSSFSCSCSRCSMRALFQILIGVATQSTVASSTSAKIHRRRRAPGRTGGGAESRAPTRLAHELEADRREHQDDLPVHLQRRGPCCQMRRGSAGEDERREVPDGFLRTQLAQAAAGEAAADRERQRAPLAGDQRRHRRQAADDGARVRAGDQAHEKRRLRASGPRRRSAAGCARRCRAVSGTPSDSDRTSRSGSARRSKIRMCRNRRNRTSIVASSAMTASLNTRVVSRNCACDSGMGFHGLIASGSSGSDRVRQIVAGRRGFDRSFGSPT